MEADFSQMQHVGKPIVFISCGQFTEAEKNLGTEIVRLVEELTQFEPYFAERVSDLDGLTRSVFNKLNSAAGFICVMHHRGQVNTPDGNVVRASVWIEQEIAIAAFLRQVLERDLRVAAFAQRGLHLEGVRQQVPLNPQSFDREDEVLAQLRLLLPTWRAPGVSTGSPELLLQPEIQTSRESAGHPARYRFNVKLCNRGTTPIEDFRAEIHLPRGLIPDQVGLADEETALATATQRVVVRNHKKYAQELPLHRGRDLMIYGLEYTIDEATWLQRDMLSNRTLSVAVHSGDMEPQSQRMTFGELGLDAYQPDPIEVADASCRTNARVKAIVDENAAAGRPVRWAYASEVTLGADGHPYVFVDGRRVFTHDNRNNRNRSLPPEYLIYS